MLVLNAKDLDELAVPGEMIRSVEEAMKMYEGDGFLMPPRMHAEYQGNVLLLMPAFDALAFGTKLVSVFPGNREQGIPVIQGTMSLNDAGSGRPLALMDAGKLTALRTGAVGAAGVKHLSDPDMNSLGIIGTGVQAWYLAIMSAHVRALENVFVTDLDRDRAVDFASRLEQETGLPVQVLEDVPELLASSETVITATTSMKPVLPGDKGLLSGRTFVGIGSFKPEMREYPEEIYPLLDHVYIDSLQAVEESGDLVHALESGTLDTEQVLTLGRQILDPLPQPAGSTRFFKSVGMALFDLLAARKIYELAITREIGTDVDFP